MRKAAVLAVLLCCAACAGAPVRETPAVHARLAEAESRAASLVRAGDYAGAARKYDEALRIAASMENADAIGANAVNLATVYQWLGRTAQARDALAIVLDDARRPFPEERRLQAELRRAILELALRNPGGAAAWAERAERRCASGCPYAAALWNVQAQIALDTARPEEAARFAQRAFERSRARGE